MRKGALALLNAHQQVCVAREGTNVITDNPHQYMCTG